MNGKLFLLPFIAIVFLTGFAYGDRQPTGPEQLIGRIVFDLPGDFISDSNAVFSRPDNLTALAIAGGISIAMNQGADNDIDDEIRGKVLNSKWDVNFDLAGNPGVHFIGTSIWYAVAAELNAPQATEDAWTMMRALSVNGATTLALKLARGNKTPNGKALAWPSGHTSSSFTVASVLHELYGWEIGIPAYAAATAVGIRMMDSGDHWASDVVFGAVLGYVVGHTIAGDKDLSIAGFDIIPITGLEYNDSAFGLSLYKRF